MQSPVSDFEDAVLCEAATPAGLDAIATRSKKHFSKAPLPAYMPSELLGLLDAMTNS